MLFNSYIFLFIFLPVVLLGHHFLSKASSQFVTFGWLVGASLVFYGYWNPAYLLLILFSIAFNYWIGKQLSLKHQSWLLTLGVVVNLLLLGYFKYFNFFIDLTNLAFGLDMRLEVIVLPLAISFFTFQQIAYLVDAYRGLCKEYHFVHYCLFVTFFPQLIAGPIVHHGEMLPQFERMRSFTLQRRHLIVGATIFVIGLFKKVVIADGFAPYATPIFASADAGEALSFFQAWQGALAYTFQLYFDFSGYSDMAIGLGRLFGIRLPLNFNSPYKATNIIDFWRRWHMTLSRFLRDYLYFPLGGNRKGVVRRHSNLFITMLLGGLWHGAGINFVIWGALHGGYLMVNHLWRKLWLWPELRQHLAYKTISTVITLLCVIVGWVFFRAETTKGALIVVSSMMNLPNSITLYLGPFTSYLRQIGFSFEGGYLGQEHVDGAIIFALAILFVLLAPNTQELMTRYRPAYAWKRTRDNLLVWRPNIFWSLVVGFCLVFSLLSMTQISEFLYFQF